MQTHVASLIPLLLTLLSWADCSKGFIIASPAIPAVRYSAGSGCLHSNDGTKDHGDDADDDDVSRQGKQIFFDIDVQGTPLGRLIFDLADPSPLPLHTANLVQLCEGGRRGIDPLAHYVGCEFEYSPATIEDGSGR